MKRRDFLGLTAAGAAAGLAGIFAPSLAGGAGANSNLASAAGKNGGANSNLAGAAQNFAQNSAQNGARNSTGKFTLWGAPAMITLPLAHALQSGNARRARPFALRVWNSPDQLRVGFVSGDFALSCAPANIGITLAHKGVDVRVLNTLTNGLNYIFTKDERIKTLGDLEGKSIIIPFRNDLPDIVFELLCARLKVDKRKIKIHYAATPPEAAQLFIARDFDAVLSQEPLASALTLLGKKNGVKTHRAIDVQEIFRREFGVGIKQAGLIVNGAFFRENGAFFDALDGDLAAAIAWIDANQDSAASLGARYLPAPEPAIKLAIPHSNLIAERASKNYAELREFFALIFAQNKAFLGGKMPARELFL